MMTLLCLTNSQNFQQLPMVLVLATTHSSKPRYKQQVGKPFRWLIGTCPLSDCRRLPSRDLTHTTISTIWRPQCSRSFITFGSQHQIIHMKQYPPELLSKSPTGNFFISSTVSWSQGNQTPRPGALLEICLGFDARDHGQSNINTSNFPPKSFLNQLQLM